MSGSGIKATLLIPDPDSIPEEHPVSFIQGVSFATAVVITAACVVCPVGRSAGTYTQCYFVSSGQPTFLMPRQEAARDVQVFSNTPLDVNDLFFAWDRSPSPDITNLGSFGTSSSAAGTTETQAESTFPGPANAIAYQPTAIPPGGQTVCVVQKLVI